ncbi:MAG: cytochrome c [Acidobacteriota bacterium]
MRKSALMALAALLCWLPVAAASAQGSAILGNPRAGRAFALQVCALCHVVAPGQLTPPRLATAPSFRSIANLPSTTSLSLQVFLVSPHPSMPNLVLSAEESANVIAYILSLKRRP